MASTTPTPLKHEFKGPMILRIDTNWYNRGFENFSSIVIDKKWSEDVDKKIYIYIQSMIHNINSKFSIDSKHAVVFTKDTYDKMMTFLLSGGGSYHLYDKYSRLVWPVEVHLSLNDQVSLLSDLCK